MNWQTQVEERHIAMATALRRLRKTHPVKLVSRGETSILGEPTKISECQCGRMVLVPSSEMEKCRRRKGERRARSLLNINCTGT